MSESAKTKFNLNLVQVLDLGCGVIHQALIKQPAEAAKALFKDLKGGKRVDLGALTLSNRNADGEVTESLKVPMALALDYSEFQGAGFSFPVFQAALQSMLNQIGQTLKAKKDLNLMTNQQTGSVLVHQPGIIRSGEQFNVMVVALERGSKDDITLRLMFVDPSQYEALRKRAVDTGAADSANN